MSIYRLYEVKVQARAQAQAVAQAQIQQEVKKILDLEKAAQGENLMEATAKERMTTEDERLMAQLYVRHSTRYSGGCTSLNVRNAWNAN